MDAETVARSLTQEQIGTYTRAFIDRRGDYIIVDGWSKEWMRSDIRQLTELGWLTLDEEASNRESGSQYTALAYRPTPEFRAALAPRPEREGREHG